MKQTILKVLFLGVLLLTTVHADQKESVSNLKCYNEESQMHYRLIPDTFIAKAAKATLRGIKFKQKVTIAINKKTICGVPYKKYKEIKKKYKTETKGKITWGETGTKPSIEGTSGVGCTQNEFADENTSKEINCK